MSLLTPIVGCEVCNELQQVKDTGAEVELCTGCGHLFIPYTEDCACGVHKLPDQLYLK